METNTDSKVRMIYNSECSKSNCAIEFAENKAMKVDIIDYIKDGVTDFLIDEILQKSQRPLLDFIRTKETIYQDLFGEIVPDEHKLRAALKENPILLQRPIVLTENSAYIARDSETLELLFP